jgi:hypothetical protein
MKLKLEPASLEAADTRSVPRCACAHHPAGANTGKWGTSLRGDVASCQWDGTVVPPAASGSNSALEVPASNPRRNAVSPDVGFHGLAECLRIPEW